MIWIAVLVAAIAQAAPVPPPPQAAATAWQETLRQPLADRIDAISAAFLGVPYVDNPAGEGWGRDPDPLVRYDAFDCLTYVETVLALALAHRPDDVATLLTQLRYGDAPPSYEARRHFMETQWLPHAVQAGVLRPTTSDYGEVVPIQREPVEEDWPGWSGFAGMGLPLDRLPRGAMALDVLPLEAARKASFRPGSILLIVRQPRANTPLWITHLGWITGDGTTLRHASQMASSMRVRDHHLSWYLDHLGTWKRWPAFGVAVFEPVDTPRMTDDVP